MKDGKRLKKKKTTLGAAATYMSLGIEMAATVLISVWAGIMLDRYVCWPIPLFTLLLAFVGMISAILILLKILKNKN
jgi:F0F1-type ATP synthase assembly protein I